jgi:hypothetical protein
MQSNKNPQEFEKQCLRRIVVCNRQSNSSPKEAEVEGVNLKALDLHTTPLSKLSEISHSFKNFSYKNRQSCLAIGENSQELIAPGFKFNHSKVQNAVRDLEVEQVFRELEVPLL